MFDIKCKSCGALFTSPTENIPEALACLCNGKDFEVLAQEIAAV